MLGTPAFAPGPVRKLWQAERPVLPLGSPSWRKSRMSLPFEPRDEDRRLLTGAGRFCDDEREAGEAHAVFVRSPHAFAAIRGIDVGAARALPGVLAVLTAADMGAAGVGNVTLASPVPNGAGLVV